MGKPHRFAHEPTFDFQKGKVKVYCRCRQQSGKLDSLDEAQEAYKAHLALVGIAEKQRLH